MFPLIHTYCDALTASFPAIPAARKVLLETIAAYIQDRKDRRLPVKLVFICTHNSRRSHFGQIWGAVAASYYGLENVQTFSGGTEATAFHPNAVHALKTIGFEVQSDTHPVNPVYTIRFGEQDTCRCFSKVYDDVSNPQEQFAAIMTCSEADENCPFIAGAELRVGTTYEDPKNADGTPEESAVYLERAHQIAREVFYLFSLIR